MLTMLRCLSVDECETVIVHKPVHIIPSTLSLDPRLDLTLLSLGTKFIATSTPATTIADDRRTVTNFAKDKRLRTSHMQLVTPLARRRLAANLQHRLYRSTTVGQDNLSNQQRRTLRLLAKDQSLVILNADKNLGLTVMSCTWYEAQALGHLHDITTYEPVNDWHVQRNRIRALLLRSSKHPWPNNPLSTPTAAKRRRQRHLTRTTTTTATTHTDAPCRFYVIPKVHKNPPTSRPIAAAHSFVTTPLSQRITPFLQHMVNQLPYIVKNTAAFLRLLHVLPQLPAHARLFTADVESLYPNIETDWALQLLDQPIKQMYGDEYGATLCYALRLVLTTLTVRFKEHTFRQISGCAMGTPLAPPYANLVVHHADLATRTEYSHHIALLTRYIDDYFGIWVGSEQQFNDFSAKMNAIHPRIKLIFTDLSHTTSFLDVSISLTNGRISTRLFRKAMNRYLYLPTSSQHPRATLNGWIKGEGIRIARTCSTGLAFEEEMVRFRNLLRDRGYAANRINTALAKLNYVNIRAALLAPQSENTGNEPQEDTATPTVYLGIRFHHGTTAGIRHAVTSAKLANARIAWRSSPSLGTTLSQHR